MHLITKEADLKKLRQNHIMSFENVKAYENHGAFLGENNRPEEMPRRQGPGRKRINNRDTGGIALHFSLYEGVPEGLIERSLM